MRALSLALLGLVVLSACDSNDPETAFGDAINADGTACLDGDLSVEILEAAPSGQTVTSPFVTVDYAGQRRPLDSSPDAAFVFEFDSGTSVSFGLTSTVAGFQRGILGTDEIAPMRIGERRQITIPPNLGYGIAGLRNRQTGDFARDEDGEILVPQCATLRFDVTLRDFR